MATDTSVTGSQVLSDIIDDAIYPKQPSCTFTFDKAETMIRHDALAMPAAFAIAPVVSAEWVCETEIEEHGEWIEEQLFPLRERFVRDAMLAKLLYGFSTWELVFDTETGGLDAIKWLVPNGRVATAAERESLTANSRNGEGRIDLVAAANNLEHWFDQSPAKICHQSIAPDKGFFRYWSGTHWERYNEVVLYRDLNWLFSGELLARNLKELVATLRAKLGVPHERFDKKPITVFRNCVLEAAGGRITKRKGGHQPEDYTTICVPISVSSKVETPIWDEMLVRVLPDKNDQQCWHELVGYCLFPSVQLQTFFALLGEAHTGKSTLLAILTDMLGSGVTSVPMARLSESHATAGLVGSICNIDSEWDDTDIYIKAVTQGWPITEEQMQLCVDKLHLALATTMDAKVIAKLVLAFKQLYGQNQAERLAARHLPTFAEGGSLEVRPLADELRSMVASMPRLPVVRGEQESIVESEGPARPNALPLFATPLPASDGFGHGVFDSTG